MTSAEVDRRLADLDHPLKPGVERLRAAILQSNTDLTEHVKCCDQVVRLVNEWVRA